MKNAGVGLGLDLISANLKLKNILVVAFLLLFKFGKLGNPFDFMNLKLVIPDKELLLNEFIFLNSIL
jgi:hypothetical protein